MALELVTPPVGTIVSLAEAKAHLVVEHNGDDTLITGLINAATREIENRLNRQLLTATWWLWLDRFPSGREPIELRLPPIQSVSEVIYTDPAGVAAEIDPEDYTLDRASEPGRLSPVVGMSWPVAQRRDNAARVEFVAGYGAADDVPATIKQAALMLIAHWYQNREAVTTGTITTETPIAVEALLRGESWGGML